MSGQRVTLDHTKFRVRREGESLPPLEDGKASPRWWNHDGAAAASGITETLHAMEPEFIRRFQQQVRSTRMYGNLPLFGPMGASQRSLMVKYPWMADRVNFNAVQSAVDTFISRLVKNKPAPMSLPSGGDYKVRRKCKKLNKFLSGIFYENKAYETGTAVARDGTVLGDGFTFVTMRDGRVTHERTMSSELWVDELDGFYGRPRQLHRVVNLDREMVKSWYPGNDAALNRASIEAFTQQNWQTTNVADLVTVRESWYLPSKRGAGDGRHVVSVDGACLTEMEEWKHDFFPFPHFQWASRLYGWWGQGGVEQVQGLQLSITKMMGDIARSLHLGGTTKILVPMGSKISDQQLNNELMSLIYYMGDKVPTWLTPQLVQPEIYNYVEGQVKKLFDQFGISLMAATSEIPAGLKSGEAIRTANMLTNDRFLSVAQAYERYFVDLGKTSIALMRDYFEAEGTKAYQVRSPAQRFLDSVDWQDIDLEEEQYEWQVFSVSSLPSEPAERLEKIQEFIAAGMLSLREGRRLLDFPDLEQIESLANAQEENMYRILDNILDEGKYEPPDAFDDLGLFRDTVKEYVSRGKCEGLEPERLDLLRQLAGQVDEMQQTAIASAAPPPAALPSGPGPQMALPSGQPGMQAAA